jgi:hypothetical protein
MDGIAIVRIALAVISQRLLIVFILALSFALGCWVMYLPSWERLTAMAFFCIYSYLCIYTQERIENGKAQASE